MRMPDQLKEFLQRWVISTVAVLLASFMVSGIHYERGVDLLVATFILGVLNMFVRPLLLLLSLPLLVVTLGLFTLFINAFLLYSVGMLLRPHFVVDSFGAAFWGGLVITLVSLVLNLLTGSAHTRIQIRRGKSQPRRRRPDDDDDSGPVIDI